MDMDIEMGDAIEDTTDVQVEELPPADEILSGELDEPGELAEDKPLIGQADDYHESKDVIPTKIHISGVHTLHTDDISAYVKTHFGHVEKIEWIDDDSANLVFNNDYIAGQAITSLSAVQIADVSALTLGESIPAKPFNGKPEVSLQLRLSLRSDKKQAGAALRSRYYLLHPEHDPEERRKNHHETRSRYRDREVDHRRRSNQPLSASDGTQIFEASMYDDAPRHDVARRKLSTENAVMLNPSRNHGKELFTSQISRRHRSASPRRVDHSDAHTTHIPSNQDRNLGKSINSRAPVANNGKELFPIKATEKGCRLDHLEESIGSARLRDEDMPKIVRGFHIRGTADQRESELSGFGIKGAASANARELFPGKLGTPVAGHTGHELLESTRSQRRQKAQDLFL
ncbi:hypothetical protein E4U46_005358 [Claviceps purpurea]|nr:hypothetical protein E4U23_006356 [Claviceps purpurea]KAG6285920.1 hypothetical protein E4U46_005358 [Claviceps purpurea]